MGGFVFSIILLISGVLIGIAVKSGSKTAGAQRIGGIATAFVGIVILLSSMFVTIDAGELGVVVIFGQVRDSSLESGIHLVVPWAKIVIYPTRIREISMTGDAGVTARGSDGLEINIDTTTFYRINEDMAGEVYSGVAESITVLEQNILMPTIRTVIRDVCSSYAAVDIYSTSREELAEEVLLNLEETLGAKGVVLDSFLVRSIDLPDEVETSIQEKLVAEQELEKQEIENERIKLEAQGKAEANAELDNSLTEAILQMKAIEAYSALASSSNTTFILMPMSDEGTGIPLILGGN